MRRRLGLLLVPVAAALWFARPRVPVEHALIVRLGAHAGKVRQVDLHFVHDGSHVRDLSLYRPANAPQATPAIEHSVRLPDGSYEVGIRVVEDDGQERHLGRHVEASGEAALEIDL